MLPQVNSGAIILPKNYLPFDCKTLFSKPLPRLFSRSYHIKCFQSDFGEFCNINLSLIDCFLMLCHLQIWCSGSIFLPKRQNYASSYKIVTLLIKWPRQEANSGRILACFEGADQQAEDILER